MPAPQDQRHGLEAEIYRAWKSAAANPAVAAEVLSQNPTPGDPALKSRFETLPDLTRSSSDLTTVTFERWQQQIDAMRTGDAAVHVNDSASAVEAFQHLTDLHRDGEHPLPLIEAQIGLGDLARQQDQPEQAASHYERAIGLARQHGCDHALVRASLGIGYAQLSSVSAAAALQRFSEAATVATSRGWRLDQANAQLGRGECHARLWRMTAALQDLLAALNLFEQIRSDEGIANAAMQLGEVSRRLRWVEEAVGWYTMALRTARRGRSPISIANALDGLAEVEVAMNAYSSARAHLREAVAIAENGYPRGVAHALNGLGRCAYAQQDYRTALSEFERARSAYLDIGLFTSAAISCNGIAAVAERLGERDLEMRARLDCVALVERTRAAQVTHGDQAEYFHRFGEYYFRAMDAAIRYGDIEGFVAVFEAVAGRRLAGLLAPNSDAGAVRLLAQLAKLSADARNDPVSEDSPERRVTRALRRAAAVNGMAEMTRAAFEDVMAEPYQHFDLDGVTELYSRAVENGRALILVAEDQRNETLYWFAHVPEQGPPHAGIATLPAATSDLLSSLHVNGLPRSATWRDVEALAALLPPNLRSLLSALPTSETITIIPAGRLWHVPWNCVPFTSSPEDAPNRPQRPTYLGERFAIVLNPTVAFAARYMRSNSSVTPQRVAWWRSCQVANQNVRALAQPTLAPHQTVRKLATAEEARTAALQATDDLVVVIAHGRPTPGIVHYIDLDEAAPLTPADQLESTPPTTLVLIACWGTTAPGGKHHGDPLSLATVALAKGTAAVAATNSELLDDPLSAAFVNQFLHAALAGPLHEALHDSIRKFLTREDAANGFLSRWAPLTVVGHALSKTTSQGLTR